MTETRTNLVVAAGNELATFTTNEIDLIKTTICRDATDEELKLFLYQAKTTGLNPLARQIYAVKRWDGQQKKNVMGIQVSIDGFRLIAERTGDYTGQVGPFWCGDDGVWKDVWLSEKPPTASKVGVWRKNFQEPCWGVARFAAYAQTTREGGLNTMWKKMGDIMISKCAEALALRKAFPQELSGLYTSDEMAQSVEVYSYADASTHEVVAGITESEIEQIVELIELTNSDLEKLLRAYKVKALAALNKAQFDHAIELLKKKVKNDTGTAS